MTLTQIKNEMDRTGVRLCRMLALFALVVGLFFLSKKPIKMCVLEKNMVRQQKTMFFFMRRNMRKM